MTFVGRTLVRSQLTEFFADPTRRILVVAGPPGIGKTALLALYADDSCNHFFLGGRQDGPEPVSSLIDQLLTRYGLQPSGETPVVRLLSQIRRAPHDARLVVDALDEADSDAWTLVIGERLKSRAHTLMSCRPDVLQQPWLSPFLEDPRVQVLELEPLTRAELEPLLTGLSPAESDVVASLSEGNPLCLKLLLQALADGVPVENLSSGLEPLFAHIISQLGAGIERVLAVLSQARDTISWEDLNVVVGMENPMPPLLHRIVASDAGGYRLFHQGLRDYLKRALPNSIRDEASDSLRRFCLNWRQNQSPYALRCLSGHLAELEDVEQLYPLARDKTFSAAQSRAFPAEPALVLAPVEHALRVAEAALQAVLQWTDPRARVERLVEYAQRLPDSFADLAGSALNQALQSLDEVPEQALHSLPAAVGAGLLALGSPAFPTLVNWIRRHSPQNFATLAEHVYCALARRGQGADAVRVVSEIQRPAWDVASVGQALLEAGDRVHYKQLFPLISNEYALFCVLSQLAVAYPESNHAIRTFMRCPD